MVAIVFDDPVSKLGRPGGPLASRILIFDTAKKKMEQIKKKTVKNLCSSYKLCKETYHETTRVALIPYYKKTSISKYETCIFKEKMKRSCRQVQTIYVLSQFNTKRENTNAIKH